MIGWFLRLMMMKYQGVQGIVKELKGFVEELVRMFVEE